MDDHTERAPGDERSTDATDAEPTLTARIVYAVRRAGSVGLVISLLVHLILWLVAANILFSREAGELGGGEPSPVEFAVITAEELAELEQVELPTDTPTTPDLPEPDVPAVELVDALSDQQLIGEIQDAGDLTASLGAGDITDGSGVEGGAGSGSTSFFGVEAVGRRFAFVVDKSGSMSHSGKWQATQHQIIRAIDGMFENAEFFVVLYATDPTILGESTRWRDATTRGKREVRREIVEVSPGGGTDPVPGFQLVAGLRPRPDAVYFMTDGEFNEALALEIIDLNNRMDVPIHCITFVNNKAAPMMRMIADKSGGTYTHVPGAGP